MLFTLANTKGTAQMPYDNKGAVENLQRMMTKGEVLDIRCGTDREGYPYCWIESKRTEGSKVQMNQSILNCMLTYLHTGFPKEEQMTAEPEEMNEDFQIFMFTNFVKNNYKPKFVPSFKDKAGYISSILYLPFGKIFFRIEKTDEIMELLENHDLI